MYPQSDHYHPQTQRFYNTPPTAAVRQPVRTALLWLLAMSVCNRRYRPRRPLPFLRPDWHQLLRDDGRNRFCWFGHSTLLLRLAGQTVLTDPVFCRHASPVWGMAKRFQAAPTPLQRLPEIDWIVYTHNHYDHLDTQTVRHFSRHKTRFLVPLGFSRHLLPCGIAAERIVELDWWQNHQSGSLTFTAVPARHDSSRSIGDHNRSLWAGWVFQAAGEQIYFSGDSAYGHHFADIGRHFGGFDWVFIENGQYDRRWPDNHMQPQQSVQAAIDAGARRVVPIHWGMFALAMHAWDDPVRQSVPQWQARGVATFTPLIGEVFDETTPTRAWWLDCE